MVLLARQDTTLSRSDSKAATLVTVELPGGTRATGHKISSFDSGHVSARHGSRAGVRRVANDDSSIASSKNSSSFEDAPFIVSGPLLPIRQHRRGLNPNRNYKVFGAQSESIADIHSHKKQPELVAAPPTPVSALVSTSTSTSTAGSSGSQSSNAGEAAPRLGSGSSHSSKSTIASISPTPNAVGVAHASPSDARAGRIREYDKHTYNVQELPMDSIVLSGHNSTASLISSHRMSRSYGQLHGAETEGRSGAVRVSSLLPGARTSPAISARRLQAQYTSPPGSIVATDGGMFTQKYLVQRVASRPSAEHEAHSFDAVSHIRISSPQIRLHNQQRSSSTP
ncbi:hypothetical protein IWW50_006397, partial [Coemansia erecta]